MLVRLSSKGQLVIPKPIRKSMGLQTGDQFDISVDEGKIVIQPTQLPQSPIDAFFGLFAGDDFLTPLEQEHQKEVLDDQVRS